MASASPNGIGGRSAAPVISLKIGVLAIASSETTDRSMTVAVENPD